MKFSTIGNRNDHERRHVSYRPYVCPVSGCKKAYFRKYELRAHGNSKAHRHLPKGAYSQLMSEMDTPNLSGILVGNSGH